MANRDYSAKNPMIVAGEMGIHDLSVITSPGVPGTNKYPFTVKVLEKHIHVRPTDGANGEYAALFRRDSALSPKMVLGSGGQSSIPGCAYNALVEYQDVLFGWLASTANLGMNMREDGLARNINNAAALAGVLPLQGGYTGGYGWVALNAAGISPGSFEAAQFQNDRYLIAESAENTTYPSQSTPAPTPGPGPSCTPSASGGTLATGDYDVSIAYVTRLNTRRMGQGITLPSPATTVSVTGATGSIAVTIPQAPTAYCTGYVVYAALTASGAHYVVGGGRISQTGTVTHTIKQTMAALSMATRFFIHSGSQLQAANFNAAIENLNPITYGTARSTTSYYSTVPLWSPFFKDPTVLHYLPSSGNASAILKSDKYDIQAGTIALAQTTTPDGEPAVVVSSSNPVSQYYWYRSVPELMAYAVGSSPNVSSANHAVAGAGGLIQLRSCLTNEVLWTFPMDDISAFQQVYTAYGAHFDFEPFITDTGAQNTQSVDILVSSRLHRGILRKPVAWYR